MDWTCKSIVFAIFLLANLRTFAQSEPCRDLDGDGYPAGSGCAVQEDCNDLNPAIHPSAPELCNGFDDDCDGELDEVCTRTCADYELSGQVRVDEGSSDGRIATADRSWAIMYSDAITWFPLYVTRFSFQRERLAPDRLYSGDEVFPEIETDDPLLSWDGARMTISWTHFNSGQGPLFREVGPWGLSGNPPLELSASGVGNIFSSKLIWNGYEYALLYGQTPDGLRRMNRITAASKDLGENLLFNADSSSDYTWHGNGYGTISTRTSSSSNFTELYFGKSTAEGLPDGPEIQLTDHTGLPNEPRGVSSTLRIVKAGPGQGYGITWSDYRTGNWNVFFARLDESGNLMTPPGEVQVSFAPDLTSDIHRLQDLIWNGEEFMLAWDGNAFGGCADLFLTRISAAGEILEEKNVVPDLCMQRPRIAWNGSEYGIVFSQQELTSFHVELATIGCNCSTDGDADGVLPCTGGDCDDSDPEVGLGMTEICTDGKDNDCDSLVDCNDPDCGQGGNPPAEITGVGFEDNVTLIWEPNSKADDYDIARGSLSDLKAMENYLWADCFGSRIDGTVLTDTETPSAGAGWYYQVRGHSRTCLVGSWGDLLKDDTLRSCP